MDTTQIIEHMEVVGSDGQHVGIVDELEGDNQIKLTKSDPAAGGEHHFIDMGDVEKVDDRVHLRLPASEAHKRMATRREG
jgi:hypothetical protein